ncbi:MULTISPECIES: spore protease YyaC [Clostridium]|uniref:Spore protease YyaC n=1 Tax=Clostridium cibarium TaxID=2762247 RepID=A0ABR8PY50_9CLOT|nr:MULTISPECIES: spore protease YyaC [Clostridium]MBD7913099.1 spore protease YyaC [Clostridium cibarium]
MSTCFSVDSNIPNSYEKIRDYLYKELKPIIKSGKCIIFLCIGTDRSTGDSLGPLIGYKLRYLKKKNFYIYGSLSNPIHSKNLEIIIQRIYENFDDPFIIAVDACLGSFQNIGKIFIDRKPLHPGLAVNRKLPPVGNMSITGIVNISGSFEFMVLQNTRLYIVMELADCISAGIYHFILKSSGNSSSTQYIEDIITFPNV